MRCMNPPDSITDLMTTVDVVAVEDDDLKDPVRLAHRLAELSPGGSGLSLALLAAPLAGAQTLAEPARRVRAFISTVDDPVVDQANAYIERLMPPELKLPEPAVLTQLYRNVRLRVDFLEQHEAWTAAQVASFAGSTAKNTSATAARWRGDGLVFAVEHQGDLLYPAFQFDVGTRRPKETIARLLALFRDHEASEWEVALWFVQPHPRLGEPPLALLDDEPDRVVAAARSTYEAVG